MVIFVSRFVSDSPATPRAKLAYFDNDTPAEGTIGNMPLHACPFCGVLLAHGQINIKEDVARCTSCGRLSKLSDVVEYVETGRRAQQMPAGCSITGTGNEIQIRATLRSIPKLPDALATAILFNGVISIFALMAIAGLWSNLVGPVPGFLPEPEMNGGPLTLGPTITLCIFLIPLIVLGIDLALSFFLYLLGQVDVRITKHDASVRTSVGPFSRMKRFDPNAVMSVEITETRWRSNRLNNLVIQVDADEKIKFGRMLTEPRQDWLRSVLHTLLIKQNLTLYEAVMKQAENRQRSLC